MLEFELEGENEWEYEGETEHEGEEESEAFFRRLANLAARGAQSPTLRRLAAQGAQAALGGLTGAREAEWEMETEWEGEGEVNPQDRAYSGALMEHLGHLAAETESEAEAEAFIGALVPLAARLIPRAASTLMRAAPRLLRGLSRTTRTLRRTPTGRQLVHTLPTVVRRTAQVAARQATAGRPMPPQAIVRTLARQTMQTVGSPAQSAQAYRRSCAMDRRFHHAVGTPAATQRTGAQRPGHAAPRSRMRPRV